MSFLVLYEEGKKRDKSSPLKAERRWCHLDHWILIFKKRGTHGSPNRKKKGKKRALSWIRYAEAFPSISPAHQKASRWGYLSFAVVSEGELEFGSDFKDWA
ncbi:Rrp5p [Corchorus olitorius]|uniref:Rrp5p n=1 Tax=Corchorus olitorius TaxID=93759 RepID=A0A1R3KM30_9ROSI|nr:Rrp5p [Corchorus olitorius]